MVLIGGVVLDVILWGTAVLVNVTALHRIVHVYRKLGDENGADV